MGDRAYARGSGEEDDCVRDDDDDDDDDCVVRELFFAIRSFNDGGDGRASTNATLNDRRRERFFPVLALYPVQSILSSRSNRARTEPTAPPPAMMTS